MPAHTPCRVVACFACWGQLQCCAVVSQVTHAVIVNSATSLILKEKFGQDALSFHAAGICGWMCACIYGYGVLGRHARYTVLRNTSLISCSG